MTDQTTKSGQRMKPTRLFATALAAACLVVLANAASAFCPTAESAREGFVLIGSEGRLRTVVKPSTDDTVTFDVISNSTRVATPTYYKGLYLMQVVTDAGTTIVTYDFDYTNEPAPDVGYQKTYKVTTKAPDGSTTTAAVDNRVMGRESIVLGDCKLDTLVFDGKTTVAGRPNQTRHYNFSPLLRTFVRVTIINEGAPPILQIYDQIERLNP